MHVIFKFLQLSQNFVFILECWNQDPNKFNVCLIYLLSFFFFFATYAIKKIQGMGNFKFTLAELFIK